MLFDNIKYGFVDNSVSWKMKFFSKLKKRSVSLIIFSGNHRGNKLRIKIPNFSLKFSLKVQFIRVDHFSFFFLSNSRLFSFTEIKRKKHFVLLTLIRLRVGKFRNVTFHDPNLTFKTTMVDDISAV